MFIIVTLSNHFNEIQPAKYWWKIPLINQQNSAEKKSTHRYQHGGKSNCSPFLFLFFFTQRSPPSDQCIIFVIMSYASPSVISSIIPSFCQISIPFPWLPLGAACSNLPPLNKNHNPCTTFVGSIIFDAVCGMVQWCHIRENTAKWNTYTHIPWQAALRDPHLISKVHNSCPKE